MTAQQQAPVIVLAFANDREDEVRYLRNLPKELRALRARLKEAEAAGLCELLIRPNATIAEVFDVFQDSRYRQRIAILHYGGHAGGSALSLESEAGTQQLAHSEGLAAFLGRQRGLELVFLNGCSTEPQVESLLAAGVNAAIATTESIDDEVAVNLADRFYSGLATGGTLSDSWSEAITSVRTTWGDAPRDLVRPEAAAVRDRWPWSLRFRPGAESTRDWSLPKAAGNPLWGLPKRPDHDLPDSPYRYLQWFREEDAEVFFGRGRQIRELYDHIAAPAGAPVLLLCGASGVGKSSLLGAGVTPYLRETHEVVFARRDSNRGLASLLREMVGARGDHALNTAWRERESALRRPLVVILDQVDEVYTRPGPTGELEAFVSAIVESFEPASRRPRGRLVLAFRKEWLAELDRALGGAGVARSKFFLERLDRSGIIEVVEGPTSSERLRRHFRLSVERELARTIADDLLADQNAPVAPTMAVLLTRMWEQASSASPAQPNFDEILYRSHRITLLGFLDEQLATLRLKQPDVVDSGLALDVLAFHTTPLGTADQRSRVALEEEYRSSKAVLSELIQHTLELHLLESADGFASDGELRVPGTRLAHDTLAPLVRMRFDESDRPGQRARRILETRTPDWTRGSAPPLDEPELEVVQTGAKGMRRWLDTERRLVERSRKRAARTRAVRRVLWGTGLAAVAAILVLSWATVFQRRIARDRERSATVLTLTTAAYGEPQRDIALLLAVEAVHLRPNRETTSTLVSALQRPIPRLVRSFVPKGMVAGLAFGRDGQNVLCATAEGRIIGWDIKTRRQGGTVLSLAGIGMLDVGFSGDATHVVGRLRDSEIRFWDLNKGVKAYAGLIAGKGDYMSVAISRDGRRVVAGGSRGLQAWDFATREPLTLPPVGQETQIGTVALSPDGSMVAWAGLGGEGWLGQLDGQRERRAHPFALGIAPLVAFSPNGRLLVSGDGDGQLRFLEVSTQRYLGMPLMAHQGSVVGLVFSPDGGTVASSGSDGTVRMWDVSRRVELGAPILMSNVGKLAFSPDGQQLAIARTDGAVQLWDVAARTAGAMQPWDFAAIVTRALRPMFGYGAAAFSRDGGTIALIPTFGNIELWDVKTHGQTAELRGDSPAQAISVAFSPDGRTLASGQRNGRVAFWDTATRRRLGEPIVGHEADVTALAFSPDGRQLFSGGKDGTLRFWDSGARTPAGPAVNGHPSYVATVAFSPDGRHVVSGGDDGTLFMWDVVTRRSIRLTGHSGVVRCSTFSEDGRQLASCGDDAVRLWNVATGRQVGPQMAAGGIRTLSFRSNGRQLVSASEDLVQLWDVETGQPVGAPLDSDLVSTPLKRLGVISFGFSVFSANGQRLVNASRQNVRLWNLDLEGLACKSAGSNLPIDVWKALLPGEAYRPTCAELPSGDN